ncbi:hypothetical protein K9B33_13355 [Sphingobium sp. 3R8]|uniref:hypothetical protein n=1 Tax=Sphingobium sp. 3R8 TaxID=2874921 RepID=UPI001CC9322E|nr:hypothetical protein [Sphingobium sp. 3R8]MBZ9648535.1 hypothetical protein [Sphingobium sp. 3R8]
MGILQFYWAMTLLCCLFAFQAGGIVGRYGAAIIAFKTGAGFWAGLLDQNWTHASVPVLMVDILCLLAFTALAIKSNRYWPLWSAGCALAAIAIHLAAFLPIGFKPAVYHGLKGLMAIPMQLLMVRGIYLDGRLRKRRNPTQ